MKKSKAILLGIGSLSLIGLFQNCGGVHFNASEFSSLDAGMGDLDLLDSPILDDKYVHVEDPTDKKDSKDCNTPSEDNDVSQDLPYSGSDLDEVLNSNEACAKIFSNIKLSDFPSKEHLHISGVHGNIKVANVDELEISGVVKSIGAKNIGIATIAGVHGSLCLQAEEIGHISGVSGSQADIAIIGPSNKLGQGGHISGNQNSDLVLVNFHLDRVSGSGRSLHVFGGRIEDVSGSFKEIHLYNGATVGDLSGVNQGVIVH